jgi:hypothetical protein
MSKKKSGGKRGGRCLMVGGGTLALVLIAAAAQAQIAPEPVVSRDVAYFNAGVDPAAGGQPVQPPNNYPASAAVCGQAKVNPGTVTNPTEIRFDDPADATRDCVVPASTAGGDLASIPFGTGYRAAARARGANTVSVWSALSNPFDIARVPPATPTGVRVR